MRATRLLTGFRGASHLMLAAGLTLSITSVAHKASAAIACTPGDVAAEACCKELGTKLLDGIFKDSKGRTGYDLVTAKLIKNGNDANLTACRGTTADARSYAYICDAVPATFDVLGTYLNKLDYKWAQGLRKSADMAADNYNPWEGLVFDLGGLSNQVVIFPVIDHGPFPQEGIEYSVYLSSNPDATDKVSIDDVLKGKVDPNKWNEAVLIKGFKEGYDPDPMIADGVVPVFGLPCGINFRYVAVVSGYQGNPFKSCTFHSSDNEIDAVAGLTEGGEGICPDVDKDGYPACSCSPPGVPCDCSDDPTKDPDAAKVHPGAPEGCSSTRDWNCDDKIGKCPTGKFCRDNQCLPPCRSGEFKCSEGGKCDDKLETLPGGGEIPPLCVPAPCGAGGVCKVGEVCKDGTCVDPCAGAKCPVGQKCLGGDCIDPCGLIKCPDGQRCDDGDCVPKCTCLAVNPCKSDTPVCASTGSKRGTCVPAGCEGVGCADGESCTTGADGMGICVKGCEGVICPLGRECKDGKCFDPCSGVTCTGSLACYKGVCVDPLCVGVECTAPKSCVKGSCMEPPGDLCLSCDSGSTDVGVSDSGATTDSSFADASDAGVDGGISLVEEGKRGGCGCQTVGTSATAGGVGLFLAGLLTLARRRRRN